MKRYCKITLFVFICILAVWGHTKKKSYRDITKEKDYFDQLQVAEIPDEFTKKVCSQFENELPKVPIILRVTPSTGVEHIFGISQQKVIVSKVYKGENIKAGDEIYLYSEHWHLHITQSENIIERGFVNLLTQGDEYLVFISRKADGVSKDLDIYETYDDSFIVPVFNYKDKVQNVAKVEDEEYTYVPYSEVKENEFFAISEEGFKTWNAFKSKMLTKYK